MKIFYLIIGLLFLSFQSYSQETLVEKNIIPFDVNSLIIKNLGPIINTSGIEYNCNMDSDNKLITFVSNRKGSKEYGNEPSHDIWQSDIKYENGKMTFGEPVNLLNINTETNEGGCSFTDSSVYISYCNLMIGKGRCDIYRMSLKKGRFSLENLDNPINTEHFESMPSVTRDETKLFYTFQRMVRGSDMDILYSYKNAHGQWTYPKRLIFNTDGNETTPFILADQVTLIFASDKIKPNYGGNDLYITRFDPDEWQWTKPQNLGKKINTKWDELTPSTNSKGDILFFSSNRKDIDGYQGDLDLYMVELPASLLKLNKSNK